MGDDAISNTTSNKRKSFTQIALLMLRGGKKCFIHVSQVNISQRHRRPSPHSWTHQRLSNHNHSRHLWVAPAKTTARKKKNKRSLLNKNNDPVEFRWWSMTLTLPGSRGVRIPPGPLVLFYYYFFLNGHPWGVAKHFGENRPPNVSFLCVCV